jgi:hypothetical protein
VRRIGATVTVATLAFAPIAAGATPNAFRASIRPLSVAEREQLRQTVWHSGCPVTLSQLRLLAVTYWGFDGKSHPGQLVVNARVAAPLVDVFRRLYSLRFPIRHMRFADAYGPARGQPKDGDISGSFDCRQAIPSPCTGGKATGSWSNHAYGEAVDLNPVENPYVGCGMSHNPKGRKYLDRSRLRPGMITPAVVQAFRSIGWGWGGTWPGSTKDYTHFSINGH